MMPMGMPPGIACCAWLSKTLREGDVLARLGGDEFAILLDPMISTAESVAFAAATGVMPLDMPESVLVRFKGKMQPGITLRDLVHAIPYYAIQEGLLTVEKQGKKNIFSGRILEIEGLNNLSIEQAFELSDATAERSAAGCTIKLSKESITEYLNSNITLLRWMIGEGYGDARTLERRAQAMEAWVANPELMEADADAEYAEVIEIDLAEINEPILCAPNDPDDARLLSSVAGEKIDEVFIGSCMTNIGHFRAAGKLQGELWCGVFIANSSGVLLVSHHRSLLILGLKRKNVRRRAAHSIYRRAPEQTGHRNPPRAGRQSRFAGPTCGLPSGPFRRGSEACRRLLFLRRQHPFAQANTWLASNKGNSRWSKR